MMMDVSDEDMTPEEFDRLLAAGDPVTLNVNVRRLETYYSVACLSKTSWLAPRELFEVGTLTGVASESARA